MLTVGQVDRLKLLVTPAAWAFYNSERFPADSRFNLSEVTVTSDAELKALAAAILTDACTVAGVLAKGASGERITIGPLTVTDNEPDDPVLLAQSKLWCAAAQRLLSEAQTAEVTRLPAILAVGKQGANPYPVFTVPKLAGCSGEELASLTAGHCRGRG